MIGLPGLDVPDERAEGFAGVVGLSVLEALVVAGLASQIAWYTKAA
ncbi:hypothetical protein [Streptomyces sp. NPDC059906]